MRRALGVLMAPFLALALGCGSPESRGAPRPEASESQPSPPPASVFGDGFLVWESNRSSNWRIWTRPLAPLAAIPPLAPSPPKRLSPNEKTRQHCCAHISPDGHWIAYLSVPDTKAGYANGGSEGALHLIRPDGSDDRVLAESARSSWESRAAVWRSSHELIYIRGDGSTVLHDLRDGDIEVLAGSADGSSGKTWLVNSRLSHAVSGAADFATFNRRSGTNGGIGARGASGPSGTIAGGTIYGGCQPYFSHDGRWGFWTAGAGGPINRVDLLTGKVSTILSKSDPRIPDGLGYAYFPMVSRDGRLFAFAASDYQHDHFRADYEIFVAESDPDTLALLGSAVRMTSHPGTDRFPDVFLEPLLLGRHRGEAPFEVALTAPNGKQTTRWDFGDGTTAVGPRVTHTFEQPGRYQVRARQSSDELEVSFRGQAVVQPAAAPRLLGVETRQEGRSVIVQFDEEIRAERPKPRFESGVEVADWRIGAEGRSLVIELTGRIDGFDRLYLEGIRDRAQIPNWIDPLSLAIEPPLWPSDRRGLAFLWETGEAANSIWDPKLGSERTSSINGSGRALLDHAFAMALGGGRFAASAEDADSVLEASRKSHEFSLEVVLRPAAAPADGLRKIISFSGGTPQSRNFFLAQRQERLVFSPRAGNPFQNGLPEVEIARLPPGETSHVLISYEVGRLVAYLNGESILETDVIQGGFFHWKPRPLLFGNGPRGGNTWRGSVEGVALYSRFIEAAEASENHLRYRSKLAARPIVARLVVDATLLARSGAPSLDEITPYREALAVFEYRVDRVVEGSATGERLRVAHWSILDGSVLEINRNPKIGDRLRLTLEPFEDNRQLESSFLADTLEPASEPLYFATHIGR